MSVETLVKNSCETIGEGPHWDEATNSLLYVSINDGTVHRWNSVTVQNDSHKFDQTVSFFVPCKKGGYMIGLGQTVCHFDWETKDVKVVQKIDDDKKTRFNDGKCDASGRLWCGTMGLETVPTKVNPNQGSLFSLEVDGSIRKHKEGVTISNGLAWTADNKTMYYIDSTPRQVFAYDFDLASGTMSNERVAVDLSGLDLMEGGFPDGMCIDTEGKLWVACYIAGKIRRYDPNTGKEITCVNIPARRTTSCCFGGKNYDELFVTCSRYGLTPDEITGTPLAGSVFRVTGLGVKGTAAPVYEG